MRRTVTANSRSSAVGSLRTLRARLAVLANQASKTEELADDILMDCDELLGRLDGVKIPEGGAARADRRLRQQAQAGAVVLELRPRADGNTDVRVDGGKLVTLSPTLAELLTILAADSGKPAGALVAWKPKDEVLKLMREKLGKALSPHSLSQLVHRLRSTLRRNGVNPFLVMTNRSFGMRFALLREQQPKAAVIEGDRG